MGKWAILKYVYKQCDMRLSAAMLPWRDTPWPSVEVTGRSVVVQNRGLLGEGAWGAVGSQWPYHHDEPVEIGLPVTRPVYLELSFFNPGGLFQSPSTATYPIFLRPSSGRKYVAEVSYIDDFYKLKLWEGGHAIEIKSLDACQKSKVN